MEHSRYKQLPNIDGLYKYLESLDWSEPWLYGLLAFYAFLYVGLYLSRRNSAIQSFSFLFMLLLVYTAEDLNEFLAQNHRVFTKQQYFDSSGLFISVVMSGPLLLACLFIVANWFYVSTHLMKEVKVLQLQRQYRAQREKSNNSENPQAVQRSSKVKKED